MKSKKPRTIECTFEQLYVNMERKKKKQVDDENAQPSPCPLGEPEFSLFCLVVQRAQQGGINNLLDTTVISIHLLSFWLTEPDMP